jgi:gliding motility-associated-like protein
MRSCLLAVFLFVYFTGFSQQNFNFSCQKDTIVSGCSTSCITLLAKIPDLYSGSSQFGVITGNTPTSSCLQAPLIVPNGPGTGASLTMDDKYSTPINIGFPFTFFGTTYTQLVASTNGYLSFDLTLANNFSHYAILNNAGILSALAGTPQDLPSTLYDKALIMGPYHDIDPFYTTSPTQLIQYTTIGTAPYRRWVLSFYKVPLFDCSGSIENTHQIVLNESTGIVQVLIYSKQVCSIWNDGRAMIGMQDFSRTQSVMVPGRRASDPAWTVTSTNSNTIPMESYSFIPTSTSSSTGINSLFKRVELYDLAGNLVSVGTTTPAGNGQRTASFNNICSNIGATRFVVKSVYQKNDDPAVEVFGTDTIRIIKNGTNLTATAPSVSTSCATPNGTLAVNVPTGSGTAPYQYSLNGGNFQTTNSFAGVAPGSYVVIVKDALGCTANVTATVSVLNNLNVKTVNDTSICSGASFTATTTSNAPNFSWTPTTGISNALIASPVLTPLRTTSYIVTASQGPCVVRDTLNVNVFQGAQVNAGSDQTIIVGDAVQLNATGGTGNYLWTPSAGLSATNISNPVASPTQTTTYTVQLTSANGCASTDDVVINVLPYCVQPRAAFTPNGDGSNDVWMVTNGNCYKSVRAEVYNRYGNKVFESSDYRNNWDGRYKGQALPDGTYYYVLTYQLINGKTVYQKGNVTILR